jgi:hypothetical protein
MGGVKFAAGFGRYNCHQPRCNARQARQCGANLQGRLGACFSAARASPPQPPRRSPLRRCPPAAAKRSPVRGVPQSGGADDGRKAWSGRFHQRFSPPLHPAPSPPILLGQCREKQQLPLGGGQANGGRAMLLSLARRQLIPAPNQTIRKLKPAPPPKLLSPPAELSKRGQDAGRFPQQQQRPSGVQPGARCQVGNGKRYGA